MPGNPEQQEKKFREFITDLLLAQNYEFLKENELFSRDTLYETLRKLCKIIADVVEADSCTVHLKLYDPTIPDSKANGKPLLSEDLKEYIKAVARKWKLTDKNATDVLSDFYLQALSSTMSFPYWRYPKGVAQLVASNDHGPWSNPDLRMEHKLVPLDSGITADIFQDNYAKIRDPFSIRSSRNLRKLGRADHVVWKNSSWRESFKNFYGSPIRIHPGGEVIGILKVENKHDSIVDPIVGNLLRKKAAAMLVPTGPYNYTKFEDRLLSLGEQRQISLFALSYLDQDLRLAYDIARKRRNHRTITLKDLFYIPYPRRDGKLSSNLSSDRLRWNNLDDCVKQAPSVQVMTSSTSDENTLLEMLEADKSTIGISMSYREVKRFVKWITAPFSNSDYKIGEVARSLKGLSYTHHRTVRIARVLDWRRAGNTLPHFYFQIDVEGQVDKKTGTRPSETESRVIRLYVFAPPSLEWIDNTSLARLSDLFLSESKKCKHNVATIYKKMAAAHAGAPLIRPKNYRLFAPFVPASSGELVILRDRNSDIAHIHSVIDLLVDRWAARIEALNHCAPVQDFSPEDTKKLSWASLEIGKLVEREISYRANRSDDSIPLTAMEFYRIPISDLCFVDDLRKRRAAAKQVKIHVDHHLQTILHTMHLEDAVRFSSRLKSYRSYLGRLGERHEGFVRGNLAIWFYLLSLTKFVRDAASSAADSSIVRTLDQFRASIDKVVGEQPKDPFAPALSFTDDDLEFFKTYGDDLIGDTRFLSPPFALSSSAADQLGAIDRCRLRLRNNLKNEGLVRATISLRNKKERDKALEDLIFRQYDPYALAATSLYCQLLNLNYRKGKTSDVNEKRFQLRYQSFYTKCFNLRQFLSASAREIADTPRFNQLAGIFGNPEKERPEGKPWSVLKEHTESSDTDAFMGLLSDECRKSPSLYLNPKGIYKRIRNLNHTLRQQRSVADLEWDLGRFDLLGGRLNCLYKNQVFATYEQLWNSGDPFWGMVTQRSVKSVRKWVPGDDFFKDRLRGRQRWLCLRTSHFEGDYYALQIASLVDPNAILEGFWDRRGYNLRRLQFVLGRLYANSDLNGAAQHRSLARIRHHLRWEYTEWYRIAAEITRTKSVPSETDANKMLGVGSFLGEAAVDYLMECIQRYLSAKQTNPDNEASDLLRRAAEAYNTIRGPLRTILGHGKKYTDCLLASFTGLGENAQPFKFRNRDIEVVAFRTATDRLYAKLLRLMRNHQAVPQLHDLVQLEREYYMKCFVGNVASGQRYIESASPIIYVPDTKAADFLDRVMIAGTPLERQLTGIHEMLVRLRREQKGYLFYRKDARTTARPGLCLRDRENVLHRIQNYALLYRPGDDRLPGYEELIYGVRKGTGVSHRRDNPCLGWTSRGLFYYLRSLIPVEIQMRTMLADTLSEQYHDSVYKGAPPKGTEFPRKQMENVASILDGVDKEMEIDFEDFIDRRAALAELRKTKTR